MVGIEATGHGRAWGERGKEQGLTASPFLASGRSERDPGRRIEVGSSGDRRRKKVAMATLQWLGCSGRLTAWSFLTKRC